MPELPEVEAARSRLEAAALNKTIISISTNDDPIVYSGCTHATFATALEGKTVKAVRRRGKNFYMVLSSPPHPILHFGMSGMAHVRGEASPVYRVPRATSSQQEWPPKYMKCCLTFKAADGTVSEWAFCDPRRLGRIKLVDCPEEEIELVKPLCDLGADPYLAMPALADLSVALLKRDAPIKAVLLNQNGPLCGIGNYMVDEILYQAAIHPSHPASALAPEQLAVLHAQIVLVTTTAVAVDADAARFPSTWLFSARWSKGKKGNKDFVLPDGSTSTISFVTVGGRTSAVVDRVQILPKGLVTARARAKRKKQDPAAEEDDGPEGHKAKEEEMKTPKQKPKESATTETQSQSTDTVWKVEMIERVDAVVEEPSRNVTSPHFKRRRKQAPVTYRESTESELDEE